MPQPSSERQVTRMRTTPIPFHLDRVRSRVAQVHALAFGVAVSAMPLRLISDSDSPSHVAFTIKEKKIGIDTTKAFNYEPLSNP